MNYCVDCSHFMAASEDDSRIKFGRCGRPGSAPEGYAYIAPKLHLAGANYCRTERECLHLCSPEGKFFEAKKEG